MLKLINISKSFNNKVIFNNVNFSFYKNNIYSIIGKSGSGKTTLLNIISSIDNVYTGTIIYNNNKIESISNFLYNNIGYIYQQNTLLENLNIEDNCFINLNNISQETNAYFQYLVDKFNLKNFLCHKCKDLSCGQKQKVNIIRALIKKPKILLCDEPTSNLDKNMIEVFKQELLKIKKNTIIIISTHNTKDLLTICDKTLNIDNYKEVLNTNNKTNEHEYKYNNQLTRRIYKTFSKKVIFKKSVLIKISTSLLSIALIGIFLSFVIKDYINNFCASFYDSNTQTIVISYDSNRTQIKEFKSSYEYIKYQKLSDNTIKEIQKNINLVKINNIQLPNNGFILKNTINKTDELIISLPYNYYRFFDEVYDHHLYITVYQKTFKIDVSYIDFNYENEYVLYCNNANYIFDISSFLSINFDVLNFLYSEDSLRIYHELLHNKQYINYQFILQDKFIFYNYLSTPRILYNDFINLIDTNNIKDFFISDNINLYIDKNNAKMYLMNIDSISSKYNKVDHKNKLIEFRYYNIDNYENEIIISKKLAKELNVNIYDKITINYFNKTISYYIKKIIDSDFNIVYGDSKFINNIFLYTDACLYTAILYTSNNMHIINNTDSLKIKNVYLNINSITSLKLTYTYIEYFSCILSFLSIILLIYINLYFSIKAKIYNSYFCKNGYHKSLTDKVVTINFLSMLLKTFLSVLITCFIILLLLKYSVDLTINFSTKTIIFFITFFILSSIFITFIFLFFRKKQT